MLKADLLIDSKAILGEGPVWDNEKECLYWLDIIDCKIHCYYPKNNTDTIINTPKMVTSLVKHKDGNLIITLSDGFYHLDLKTKEFTFLYNPKDNTEATRFNDGKCDCKGRFWAGTMALDQNSKQAIGAGALYRMDSFNSVEKILDSVTISNGLAWNSNNTKMYYIDTPTKAIAKYDFNKETGEISNKEIIIHINEKEGFPDGMTIDSEGMLWIAHWGGFKVSRWDPNKKVKIEEIILPTRNVTCCTFGGENLTTLYITTARDGLDKIEANEFGAGGLYKIDLNITGFEPYLMNDKNK